MGRPKSTIRRTPIERMQLVATIARQVAAHPLVQSQSGYQFSLTAGGAAEPGVTLAEPDEHLLRSLLLDVRQLIAKKEASFLAAAINLGIRHIDDPELNHGIESAKEAYGAIERGEGIRLVVDGRPLEPQEAVDL